MILLRKSLLVLAMLAASTSAVSSVAAKEKEEVEEPAPLVGQDTPTKTLAERIPSVTHRAFVKRHRVELYPEIGLSFTDPFYRYVMPGLGLNYYIIETLAVGVAADFFGGVSTTIDVTGGVTAPITFNRPQFDARLQLNWLPLYGKISWLAESVLHFDMYLTAGVGVMGLAQGGASPEFTLAVGQHYFVNNWVALRLELRNALYGMVRTSGGNKELQSLLSASLGLCFYLPQNVGPED